MLKKTRSIRSCIEGPSHSQMVHPKPTMAYEVDSSGRGTSQSCGDSQVFHYQAVDSYLTPKNSISLPPAQP